MTTTTVEQVIAEVFPTVEALHAEVYPAIETVQTELVTLQEERQMQKYWEAKYHLQIDGTPLNTWDAITRRRWLRQLTRKQMALGEEILRGIQDREVGNP